MIEGGFFLLVGIGAFALVTQTPDERGLQIVFAGIGIWLLTLSYMQISQVLKLRRGRS